MKEDSKNKTDEPAKATEPAASAGPPAEEELSSADGAQNQPAASKDAASPAQPKKPSKLAGLRRHGFHHTYLVAFVLLLLIAGAGFLVTVKVSKKSNPKTTAPSLTSQQLSELKGSTTVVGDAQQVLDIQSNSVFEGQVLLRNNLDVAGTLKVGGPLSLPGLTVGGTSTLAQVTASGPLNVGGLATLQKGLSVTGPVSFSGTVSAGQLSVTNLQLTGDLLIPRHIVPSGGIPAKTNGTGLGSGGTLSINGTDTSGTVTINTGGSPPAGCFGTFNFTQKFNTTPHVVISPSNSSAAALEYYTNRSNTSFSVCTANTPNASTTYSFDYIVMD